MFEQTTSKDLGAAVVVTLAGGVALSLALRAHWVPQDLSPGVEGGLTASFSSFLMALLHPLPYRRALALLAPLIAALFLGCASAAGPAVGLGMAGLQLVLMGIVGLALAARARRLNWARAGHGARPGAPLAAPSRRVAALVRRRDLGAAGRPWDGSAPRAGASGGASGTS